MTEKTTRRLPDGSLTKDVDRYCSAWQELGDAVAQFFPYYQLSAYDPGICLDNGVETLRFSVPQAMLLLQTTSTMRAISTTPPAVGVQDVA